MDVFKQENVQLLVRALMQCQTETECAAFLEDLMTTREVLDLSQRIAVASQLHAGGTCNQIAAAGGASSATVSRVNRCYRYGAGGYRLVLERLDGEEDSPDDHFSKESEQ